MPLKYYLRPYISKYLGNFGLGRLVEFPIVLSWLEPKRGEKVCDIACGNGELSFKIARKGCQVYGMDISKEAIETARILSDDNTEFKVGDAGSLPYQSEFFDKVVCNSSLEHFPDDAGALREMNRVLKPNGVLVLTVDTVSYPNIPGSIIEAHRKLANVVSYYTDASLKEKLEKAGFKVVCGRYYLNSPLSFSLWKVGIKLRFNLFWVFLSLICYPFYLLSDRLFGRANGGCGLAMKARKGQNSAMSQRSMKILLVNPPQTLFPGSIPVSAGVPLGLLYIAAVLDGAGYSVEILDTLVADLPPQRVGDTKQVGMPWPEIKDEIKRRQPDIVGITNPFTTQVDNAVEVARIVKEIDTRLPTIIGGPHVSVRAVPFLEETNSVDVVVLGEGEHTMLEIVEHYMGRRKIDEIRGIAYKKDGRVVLNPPRPLIGNLDELPLPAYHLIDMEAYLNPKRLRSRNPKFSRELAMITSRGCPFNCIFCSIHLHMGRKWRAHSVDYVVQHIEHVVRKYGVKHLHFEDDGLNIDNKRLDSILDSLAARNIKITWDTPNGIRADNLTMDHLRKMKQSGCTDLIIGVESGDQYVLDNIIDKHLRLENAVQVASMCQQLGIKLQAFFVIGFPGEKKGNMQQTIDFALNLRKRYGTTMNLLVATPLYGTRLYDICREKGYLTQELTPRALAEASQTWGKGLIKTEDFTPEEVKKLASKAASIQSKLSLLSYIRRPGTTVRLAMTYPEASLRLLKNLVKL